MFRAYKSGSVTTQKQSVHLDFRVIEGDVAPGVERTDVESSLLI